MKKRSVVGLLCCLGVASLAQASVQDGSRAPAPYSHTNGSSASRKIVKLAIPGCSAPQMVREDQGLGAYQDVPVSGGTFVMIVLANPQCSNASVEDSPFVTLTARTATTGQGPDHVTYVVQPNTGAARTANITASGGAVFTIRQAGVPGATPPAADALSSDPTVLGAQRTCGTVPVTVVKSGAILKPETWVLSPSRQHKLILQKDGNLVLYKANGDFVWNSGKLVPGGLVKMQTDGNFVAYDSAGKAKWASSTSNKPGAWLAVQDDGKVIVYSPESCDDTAHWYAR